MKIPTNNNQPPNGGERNIPNILLPSRIIPDESDWIPINNDNEWRSDAQPYYARATFMKLCLPAVLYSLILNVSLKMLSLVPFTSRLNVQRLHYDDCFVLPSTNGDDETTNPIAIVTGSNTGVGFQTAKGLVQHGYNVILACRSREKGEGAAKKINDQSNDSGDLLEQFGKASFLHPLDLSSFSSIRSFCKVYSDKYSTLNILVNNAGINSQGDVTEDGLEMCFQSNFVGHFLLTRLLLPHLLKAKNICNNNKEEAGRVVNLSSVTHHFAPANERLYDDTTDSSLSKDLPLNNGIHDKHFWLGSATPGLSNGTYRESKLASILFTMELNKRYGSQGLRSVAVDPGSVASDIWRDESQLMQNAYKMVYLTPKQGASTSIAASIGILPKDAFYLQPYLQWRLNKAQSTTRWPWYKVPNPITEMLGKYIGYAITDPRLPNDGSGGYKSSNALWSVCEKITSQEE